MNELTCSKCDETLPTTAFSKHRGNTGRGGYSYSCKKCVKEYQTLNKDSILKNHKDWLSNNKQRVRDKANEWAKNNVDKVRDQRRRSRVTCADHIREYRSEYRKANGYKIACHVAVSKAVGSGELVKLPCEICGNVKANAHHEDYSKPLEVVWLCQHHHVERHQELEREGVCL